MNLFNIIISIFNWILISIAFIFFAGFLLIGDVILFKYLIIDAILIIILQIIEYKINQYR
jgi:hypothetical protein